MLEQSTWNESLQGATSRKSGWRNVKHTCERFSQWTHGEVTHMWISICTSASLWETPVRWSVCAHVCVSVISVRQDDLKVLPQCNVGLLSPSLSPSYQNLLDGLLWKPRRKKRTFSSLHFLSLAKPAATIWTNYWRSQSQQTQVCLSMYWGSEIERGRRAGDGEGETDRISWVAVIPLPLSHACKCLCTRTHMHALSSTPDGVWPETANFRCWGKKLKWWENWLSSAPLIAFWTLVLEALWAQWELKVSQDVLWWFCLLSSLAA